MARHWIGQPFVNNQIGGGAEGRSHIRGIRRRRGQLPLIANAPDRVVGHLKAKCDRVHERGAGVEQEDAFAIAVQTEACVEARCGVGQTIAPNHQKASGANSGAWRKNELSGIAAISETPARQIDGAGAAVAQLDPVRMRVAVGHGREVFGHDFIQPDIRIGKRRWWSAGRAVQLGARSPIGWVIRVARRIDDFQRVAAAVCRGGPAALIIVIHRDNNLPEAIANGDLLAAVI